MDLKETNNSNAKRHPWESARLKTLQHILGSKLFEGIKVLDIGCGDGYVSRTLFSQLHDKSITAVDINLSDEWILELGKSDRGILFQKEMPLEEKYDLILLLDVIEHIEFDKAFLADIVDKHLLGHGKIMITVPAFQALYGKHDAFLGHYRRYQHNELTHLVSSCGLTVLSSGYLFFTLLLPKLFMFKLFNIGKATEGVGNWKRGKIITRIIEKTLTIDNRLLIAAGKLGIKIPGLTGWVLCEKRD